MITLMETTAILVSNAVETNTYSIGPNTADALVMFASQAAMVIANARRYRDEQRARADLETLINTSPVGVVVLRWRGVRCG